MQMHVCTKSLYKAEEKKKRQSVQSKAGTDGGLAGPVAPSRQKKDSAFKETQGQDCHDSYDGDLRPRPLQLQWLCAKVPRGGALPPRLKHWGVQRHERRAKSQIFPSPAFARSFASLLRQRFSHGARPSASACRGAAWCKQMMQADWGCSAGALLQLRLGQEDTTVTAAARCLHGQDQESLFWKYYTVSDAAFFLPTPPKDTVELFNGTWQVASNLPALTRWDTHYPKTAGPPPRPATLEGAPGSGGRSPVRKGCGSRRTSQTRKQAPVPPEEPVPGMQQGKRFRCTCRCTVPGPPPPAQCPPSAAKRE